MDPKDFSPLAKIPVKIQVLLQAGLRRLLDLTERIHSRRECRPTRASLQSTRRAAMETAMSRL